jgi:threonine dehydratase
MGLLRTHADLRVEPTGALALAALLTDPARFRGREVVCVVSGGNVDPAVYARMVG